MHQFYYVHAFLRSERKIRALSRERGADVESPTAEAHNFENENHFHHHGLFEFCTVTDVQCN